jgi:hypothetical protein
MTKIGELSNRVSGNVWWRLVDFCQPPNFIDNSAHPCRAYRIQAVGFGFPESYRSQGYRNVNNTKRRRL